MPKQDIYEVTFSSPEIKVLGDYLKAIDSPAFPANVKNIKGGGTTTTTSGEVNTSYEIDWAKYAVDFCGYIDNFNKSNLNKIQSRFSYDPATLVVIGQLVASNQHLLIPLKPGISFSIPKQNLDKATLLTQGLNVVTNDGAFKAKALYDLEQDSRYTPVNTKISSNALSGNLKEFYPDMTIWLWCRGLSPQQTTNPEDTLQGQIFDITRFVLDISTSMTRNGGNFQIRLAPIVCLRDPISGYWAIDSAYTHDQITDDLRKEYLAETQIDKIVNGTDNTSYELSRNNFLFHNSINTNDVIFIRYETLEIEVLQRIKDAQIGLDNNFIDKNELPNKIYDMIGLVDNNRLGISPANNEITIEIGGRDLSKLFIEDGTYFYALENEQGTLNFAGGTTSKNEFTRRVVNNNALLYLGLYFNNSIEKILEFIIQQLSTITVVPDNLFSAYELDTSKQSKNNSYLPSSVAKQINQSALNTEKLSKSFQLSQDSKQKLQQNTRQIKTDTESVKKLISSFRKTNGLTALTSNGKIDKLQEEYFVNNVYSQMHSFVSAITTPDDTTKQIIATFGNGNTSINTTGSTTQSGSTISGWGNVTNPDFETSANIIPSIFLDHESALFKSNTPGINRTSENVGIINGVWSIIQSENSLITSLTESDVNANGIWQIISLVIDSSVTARRIIDSSISSANGSLLNFIRKVCQEPFVEFFMDTYGDKYYLIVRKPPFDRDGMTKYISGNVYTENNQGEKFNIDSIVNAQYSTGHPLVMDIEAIDVIQENLVFDDSDVYSWYHFTPKGSFFGNAQQYSLAYIPAIFFDEYAEIWGSKPLDIVNNYTPYIPPYSKSSSGLDISSQQAFYDLKYLVETNQYNPFVRKGSIVMNRDRRMKIGNPVRYKPTGEIFWIEGVSHSSAISVNSIDATTTIQVSRGMVEKFINGITGAELNTMFKTKSVSFTEDKVFSYFNIINTTLNFNKKMKVPIYKDVNVNGGSNTGNVVNTITSQTNGTTSPAGVEFIKDFESFVNHLYLDTDGKYAIGYGSKTDFNGKPLTKSSYTTITPQQGEDLLRFNLQHTYEYEVNKLGFAQPLLQNQFDALVDYAYNHGSVSRILRAAVANFQSGNIDQATLIKIWTSSAVTAKTVPPPGTKATGTDGYNHPVSPTLFKRRTQEVELFLNKIVILQSTEEPVTKQVIDHYDTVVDQSQVLNNFKVDKEIFNFFLRKQQLDYFKVNY